MDFTVAICTYNGANRLPRVLDCLHRCDRHMQECGCTLGWEIVVVDNNSHDATPEVITAYQAREFADRSLRYVRETSQGLAYARQRAIAAAASPLVGFLDDDNWPAPDWIMAAHACMAAMPRAAAIGSRVLPDYEVEPPPEFERISGFLAITDRGDRPRRYEPAARVLPPGAGLVVRRDLWRQLVPPQLELVGRIDGQMLASEDLEALLHMQTAGWEIWYSPTLIVRHRIPRWRLTEQYLSKLMYGIGRSRYRTRMMKYSPWQRFPMLLLYVLSDSLRLVRSYLRGLRRVGSPQHNRNPSNHQRDDRGATLNAHHSRPTNHPTNHPTTDRDIVAIAQRQLYWGSLHGMAGFAQQQVCQFWRQIGAKFSP